MNRRMILYMPMQIIKLQAAVMLIPNDSHILSKLSFSSSSILTLNAAVAMIKR